MAIALISSTHRPDSYTRRVALYLARQVEERTYTYYFIDFQTLPRDFLFSDLFGARSERFRPTIQMLEASDPWIWVVPEYNGSFPGVVKVFIDALPREVFRGRQAALVGVSDGRFGNLRGLDHLSQVLAYCGMRVLPFRAHLMHIQSRWQESTGQPDPAHAQELATLLARLEASIGASRD